MFPWIHELQIIVVQKPRDAFQCRARLPYFSWSNINQLVLFPVFILCDGEMREFPITSLKSAPDPFSKKEDEKRNGGQYTNTTPYLSHQPRTTHSWLVVEPSLSFFLSVYLFNAIVLTKLVMVGNGILWHCSSMPFSIPDQICTYYNRPWNMIQVMEITYGHR